MADNESALMIASSWMTENQDFSYKRENGAVLFSKLHHHWNRATVGMNSNTDKWFSLSTHNGMIVTMYSEPGRFYHTLVHLGEMLGFLDLLTTTPEVSEQDYKVLVLTVFFHDIVYDPKSATNEEDSAKMFEDFWSDCCCDETDIDDNEVKARVKSYILATKNHNATEGDACAQLLLDIDMAVLGKTRRAYWVYAGLIRQEYSFVEHDVYCQKRAEVLKGFLKCSKIIFGTKTMSDALENRARENLQAEIEALQSGRIPYEDI